MSTKEINTDREKKNCGREGGRKGEWHVIIDKVDAHVSYLMLIQLS